MKLILSPVSSVLACSISRDKDAAYSDAIGTQLIQSGCDIAIHLFEGLLWRDKPAEHRAQKGFIFSADGFKEHLLQVVNMRHTFN
jgi:hypothetical protein